MAQALYSRRADSDLEAEDHFLVALGLSLSGRVLPAQWAFERALAADPNHNEALYLFTVVAYDRVQKLDAAPAAKRLAQRPGWEAKGDLLLGMIRESDNDPSGAVAALHSALQRDPQIRSLPSDPFSTQKLLARNLLRAARPGEARELLSSIKASRAEPEVARLLSRTTFRKADGVNAAAALARSRTYRGEHPLEPEAAPYVGSTRCASCHREIQIAVVASRHALNFHARPGSCQLEPASSPLERSGRSPCQPHTEMARWEAPNRDARRG